MPTRAGPCHLLLLFLFLLFLYFTTTETLAVPTPIYQLDVTRGRYTISLVYTDHASLSDNDVVFTSFDPVTDTVWLLAVESGSSSKNFGCRVQSIRKVVVGPNACSDPDNPSAALESTNCFRATAQRDERYTTFLNTWWLKWGSPECIVQANNDKRLCLGPLLLSIDAEVDFGLYPTDQGVVSDLDLLRSRAQYLYSGMGPYCATPTVVEVLMELPTILVTTDCDIRSPSMFSYQGVYSVYEHDNYVDMVTTVWKVFQNNAQTDYRLMLVRSGGSDSLGFKIKLGGATGSGVGELYWKIDYESVDTFQNPSGALFFLDWVEILDLTGLTVYQMVNPLDPMDTCSLQLTTQAVTNSMHLPLIEIPTGSDFARNKLPLRYGRSRMCNAHFGRLDYTNREFFAQCPEGAKCGGTVEYVYPEYPYLPVFVAKDEAFWRDLSCETIYPKNSTFFDFAGTEIEASNPQQELCYYPFLLADEINDLVRVDEKWRQCQIIGGIAAGQSQTHCAIPISEVNVRCKKGWVFVQDKCVYKFNPSTDGIYRVSFDNAHAACQALSSDPLAEALTDADAYVREWLATVFVYIGQGHGIDRDRISEEVDDIYKITRSLTGTCLCYDGLNPENGELPCDCFDETTAFPVCVYTPLTTEGEEPKHAFVGMSVQTAALLRDGQEGPKHSGLEASCRCFAGWTGRACQTATCPLRTLVAENPSDISVVTEFFRKCYNNGGSCLNGQVRVCQCERFFGPPAAVIPSLADLYVFRNIPCGCPASPETSGEFVVNDDTFQLSGLPYLPCAGSAKGKCVVGNSTNIGVCESTLRNVPNPSIDLVEEDSFDGRATTCMIPIQPYLGAIKNGPIVSSLCNSRGTCCPFGESEANPFIGDRFSSSCFDEERNPRSGCSCDNGWGGEACTCPTSWDLARERFIELHEESLVFVDLGSRYAVQDLNITARTRNPNATCDPYQVELTNDVEREGETCERKYR